MKLNAAAMALARRVVAPASLALALVAPALGGDRAGIHIIGYSDDLRYFAFEEFGIQDGSGFAYANVQIIDLETDSWVKGTPVRELTEDEGVGVSAIRAQALASAEPLLDQYAIVEPADILALNGDGDATADFNAMTLGMPGYGLTEPGNQFTLKLGTFKADGDPRCNTYDVEDVYGFSLTIERDGDSNEVYRDTKVPNSRGCVEQYRLYGVVTPFDSFATFNPDPLDAAVAIISYYRLGFEGPDRRFIAVPLAR